MKLHPILALIGLSLAALSCNQGKVFTVSVKDTPAAVVKEATDYAGSHPGTAIRVVFGKGEHFISEAIKIEGIESEFILTGRKGAVISGECLIGGWEQSDLGEGIWQANLKECGINDYGKVVGDIDRVDLYYKGKRQQISRYPNEGFIKAGKVLGPTENTVLPRDWRPEYICNEGIIEYTDPHMDSWAEEDEPNFFGYWHWDWYDGFETVAKFDKDSRTITFNEPWSEFGYREGCSFYGLNLKCEIDMPGEYYIDRRQGVIYFFAPEGFDGTGCSLSVFGGAPMISVSNCSKLTVKDLKMTGGRDGAITIDGGSDNTVEGCEFTRFGNVVISIKGGTGHSVRGCYIYETGQGGIQASGGDRSTLTPAGFVFSDNIMEDTALYKRTYQPGIAFSGVGITVDHNRFQRMPSSALCLTGNDINIEYNQFFDLVRESDDQGGFDAWGDYTFKRINFTHNHWRNIRGGTVCGAAGIRFDDMISGNIIRGEIFEACGEKHFGGVQIHGGKDNIVENCIFYDCPCAVTSSPWSVEHWHRFQESYHHSDDLILSPLYLERYPEMANGFDSNMNVNTLRDNIIIGGKLLNNEGYYICENNSIVQEMEKPLEYWLQDKVLESYGLKPIPFGEIGPRNNKFDNNQQ